MKKEDMSVRAEVILMKCPDRRQIYGVRVQEQNNDWFRTWAFPLDERRASHEGFDKNKIIGNLFATDEYNGCPYCGSITFVQCGACNKLSCWKGQRKITCAWCGLKGEAEVTTDALNVSSGDL